MNVQKYFPTLSILRQPGENYFNQKQFADFLSKNGLHNETKVKCV
jgi:hypothetical protein